MRKSLLALLLVAGGAGLGNVGHLVQIPVRELDGVLARRPSAVTVYDEANLRAVGAAAAFLKWEWTVAAGFAAGVVFHILFFLYMKQRYIHWEKEKRDAAYIGQMGAALAGSRLFVEAGLAAAVVLWTPLSILGFLAGLLSLFPATIWARQ